MHEAQEWREMHEALHEAHELQNEAHEMAHETSGRRSQRIVTPAVIIRITLAPMRGGKIFGTPKAIVGATQHNVLRCWREGRSQHQSWPSNVPATSARLSGAMATLQ